MNKTKVPLLDYNPTLESVLMVEKAIHDYGGEFGKYRLWKHLPKKMMYQTFCTIIDYLLYSGKIAVDRKGKICWIYNPALFNKYINRKDLER